MKKVFAITALTAAAVTGTSVSAHWGGGMGLGQNYNSENYEEMTQVLENGNYEGWLNLMQENCRNRLQERVSEEDFSDFASGQLARMQERAQIQTALENGDFASWKALISADERGSRILDLIDEDNFARFVEMHNLRQAGDFEGAQEIAQELGMGRGMGGDNSGKGRGGSGSGMGIGLGQKMGNK